MTTTKRSARPDSRQAGQASESERRSLQGASVHDLRHVLNPPEPDELPRSNSAAGNPNPLPETRTFHPVNPTSSKKSARKKAKAMIVDRPLAPLAPAPPRAPPPAPRPTELQSHRPGHSKSFYDIPPELRVEIYHLVLASVTMHILPREAELDRRAPHALTRVSRTVRNEVLPIVHATCSIVAVITDFNFSGLQDFMGRIPPQDQKALLKNDRLKIQLCTTDENSKAASKAVSDSASLRRWLKYRADPHQPQPRWQYCGIRPGKKVQSDLRRRIKRMPEEGKRAEMAKLARGIGVPLPGDVLT